MTRTGIVRQLYSKNIESRPFTRFTNKPDKIGANEAWFERAKEWGDKNIDQHGHYVDLGGDSEKYLPTVREYRTV